MLSGGKKDVEFEEPGMDALGENMYSHISIFFFFQGTSMLELHKRNINYKVSGISSCGPNKME